MHNTSSSLRHGWLPQIASDLVLLFMDIGVHISNLFLLATPATATFSQRRRCAKRGFAFIAIALACLPSAASAMYKCVDANGTHSFQDSPCKGAVRDKSTDPVVGTKGPMPIKKPQHNATTPNQPAQTPDQMPVRAPIQVTGAPHLEQNMNTTEPNTGVPVSKENTKVPGGVAQFFVALSPLSEIIH